MIQEHPNRKNKYTEILKYLISKGANVNYYKYYESSTPGETPLSVAAGEGDTEKMEILLKAGANPDGTVTAESDYSDYKSASPLYEAISNNEIDALKMLIKAGADIRVRQGRILTEAAKDGKKEAVKVMLSSGQDISTYATDAIREALGNHKDIALMLVRAEVDAGSASRMWKDKNTWSSSPFSESVLKKDKELAEMLFSSVKNERKRKAIRLMFAVQNGDYQTVDRLLKEGVSLEADNVYEETPLYVAINKKNADIVKTLLKAGADIKSIANEDPVTQAILTDDGELLQMLLDKGLAEEKVVSGRFGGNRDTFVIRAAMLGKQEALKVLIKNGADVNMKNRDGENALLQVTIRGEGDIETRKAIVNILLDAGADINEPRDGDKMTPLMWAAYKGNAEMVKLLLSKGADVNLKNSKGKTALDLSKNSNRTDAALVTDLLKKAGAK